MSIAIQIQSSGWDRLHPLLQRAAQPQVRELMEAIGGEVENQVKRRIHTEAGAPSGEAWPKLSPRYAARKKGGSLLQAEGYLLKSIVHEATDDSAAVGTNKPYAATHQFGRGGIPARTFLGLSEEDHQTLEDMIEAWGRDLLQP